MKHGYLVGAGLLLAGTAPALADDLYKPGKWSSLSADYKASSVGDAVTIVIFQAAEASNSSQSSSRKRTELSGDVGGGPLSEGADVGLGGGYNGRGEVKRNERLVAQISAVVKEVLPNGDLVIVGDQWMQINGERTRIGVRGRVRPMDVGSDNKVQSSRIADAQINYDGRGFVSRSANPGLLNRLFNFLGLG